MELFLPDQIVLDDGSRALLDDVEETARRVNEYRPLPKPVVKRIQDNLLGERVYSSNAIEGNTLDLRETVAVLNTGRIIENKRREAIEARNLGEAARRVSEVVAGGAAVHTVEQLLAVHRVILRETPDEFWGGRFREQRVLIDGAKYQPPDHTIVPTLVERVMERLRQRDDAPGLLRACWAHWALARIHPFKDGNGRTARLWQDLVLFQENLTCAIVLPEQRREYLDALTHADEGDFNPLVQLTAQRVLTTFDKYLSEIASDRELDAFAHEIAGEADARLDQKRQLAYQRWARKMEQLRWEFEVCASRITERSGQVRIQLRKYDMIVQGLWENISGGASASRNRFFELYFDCGERRRRYIFFFGKHYPSGLDDARERSENRVCLLISEDDGSGRAERLDKLDRCPISAREIFVLDDAFVVKRCGEKSDDISYDRGIAPMRIAQDFIREVVLRRLI
jgi:Fic family protein